MDEHGYGRIDDAALPTIRQAFSHSREKSVARHNAQITRRAVHRSAVRHISKDASSIGLAVVVIMGILALARIFVG